MRAFIFLIALPLFVLGCGVKSDPVSPDRPVEIGSGRPEFRRKIEDNKIKKENIKEDDDEKDDEKSQEE